ncbi:MAG TPA: SulP family inorganic anion transporter [Firmicutes bacterium]|nr:SulP family inorganic anion transporter [Bacillota bacterium]
MRALISRYQGDLISGMTTAVVALPLALAFGIASGAGAAAGLYAAIFAGFVASLCGGSEVQVSGPTGAMTVILVGIINEHGIAGMLAAGAIAGLLQLMIGFMGLGRLIKYLPQQVISGFTNGIAVIIFLSQVETALNNPIVASATIAAIFVARLFAKKVPAALVGLTVGISVNALFVHTAHVVGDLPFTMPVPSLPLLPLEVVNSLMLPAFTICLLGSIEALLSAEVGDALTGQNHDADRELIGQGLGNIVSALVGGVPITGAIARTAVNAKAGGRTRLSGMIHSVTLLLIILLFREQAQAIPLAALAAILMATAIEMVDWESLTRMYRASWSYTATLLVTMVLTVTHDLVVGVAAGCLTAVCFVIADLAHYPAISLHSDGGDRRHSAPGEAGVNVLRLRGPLYFIGVQGVLEQIMVTTTHRTHLLDFSAVAMIDDSAALVLKEQMEKLAARGIHLFIGGVSGDPLSTFARLGMLNRKGRRRICKDLHVAMERALAKVDAPPKPATRGSVVMAGQDAACSSL